LTLSVSNHSIFLILGKDHKLRAFHNICRHRAYEVTRKECGSSTVLGCRYHGWSYDTLGGLIKAPEFDKVEGFQKEKNGLWEITVKVLVGGVVLINFDSESNMVDERSQEQEELFRKWNVIHTNKIGEFRVEGNFNWKLAGKQLPFHERELLTSQQGKLLKTLRIFLEF
jgi:phenylpropionate dioxygenase-like ring-hydroxylating dioxygenase large terminal subunit